MVAASEISGKLLMVSQSRRYFRAGDAFGRQIAELGAVGSLSCEFFKAPHFGGFREQMAEPLLIDMAIHQFDLARKLIGSAPVSVYCESYNPEWSWFDGNAAANADLRVRQRHPVRLQRQLVRTGARDVVERSLASQYGGRHGDLGRRQRTDRGASVGRGRWRQN